MFKLASYRKAIKGVPDLLNYAALVDDGVMLNKDGSLLAGFVFRGVDTSSASETDRNLLTARFNELLCNFGTGWMIHVDAIRSTAPAYLSGINSQFSHPAFAMIDEERRQFFSNVSERYESDYFLFLTYMPPNKTQSKIRDLMFEHNNNRPSIMSGHLDSFKKKVNEAKTRLAPHISIKRLKATSINQVWYCELLQAINRTISGNNHKIRLPFCPTGIDSIIGGHELFTGINPKLNNQYFATVCIDNFPDDSTPSMLNHLDKLGMPYRWNTRFSFFDLFDAEKALDKERKLWKQRVVSFQDQFLKTPNPRINEDAQHMVWQYDAALTLARSGALKYGHYTSTIVLRNHDLNALNDHVEWVQNVIALLGFHSRAETVNNVEAFLGTLPSDSLHNIRRPLLSTVNLSDMLPLSSIWSGSPTNPCPFYPPNSPPLMQCSAEGAAPFRLNLHVDDVGHTLVFGPTGSGKSTLLAMIAAQADRYAPNTYIFDKGYSTLAISQCGGIHYDIGVDDAISFAPLSLLRSDFKWSVDYVIKLLKIQDFIPTGAQRIAIEKGLKEIADSAIEHITLSEYLNVCNDEDIFNALSYYANGGGSDLLNAKSDQFGKGKGLQVFEIGELMSRGDADLLPVILYLFRQIERSLDGTPTFIIIDECWIALKHPVFADMIVEWLKTLRNANCAVLLFTQSLTDASKSDLLADLIESCPTKIYLANPTAVQFPSLYQQFGLNQRQIEIIQNAVRKRDYYMTSTNGNRLFDLSLGNLTLSFVGASGKTNTARIRELVKEHGDEWYLHWLAERGVNIQQFIPD